jgi:hypothetical protein
LYHQEFVCLSLDIQALVPSIPCEIEITNSNLPDPGTILFQATIWTGQKEATATAPIVAASTTVPHSPISTLTDKVNNAAENLNELKNNQRRIRKDHKSTVTSLRSEIETLHSRLEVPGKGEERARRGNLAKEIHIKQTKDKIHKLEEELRLAEESIANRQRELLSGREKWESERSALETSLHGQSETKSTYDTFLQQFHAEKMAIDGRKEKLMLREVKLKSELDNLEAEERRKHEKLDDRSTKRQEARIQLIKDRQASQSEQIMKIEQMESRVANVKEQTARAHADRLVLESFPIPRQQSDVMVGSPVTSLQISFGMDGQEYLRKGSDSPETL